MSTRAMAARPAVPRRSSAVKIVLKECDLHCACLLLQWLLVAQNGLAYAKPFWASQNEWSGRQ